MWTAEQLATFLRHAAGHRYFPAIWTSAFTGMRRSELLGLKWSVFDLKRSTLSINRARVDVAYEVVESHDITPDIGASRGKTKSARRRIDLDPTTIDSYQHVLPGMQADAAQIFAELVDDEASTGDTRWKNRKKAA